MKQSFKEYMEENNHVGYDVASAVEVAELLFLYELQRLEVDEPYAVNSMNSIKVALEVLSHMGET